MRAKNRRGAGLILKFSLLMIALVVMIVAGVAVPLLLRMVPREQRLLAEGLRNRAGILMESGTGTNGIIIPPQGYMQGVRALFDNYGIVMIADEVMSGFGRGHPDFFTGGYFCSACGALPFAGRRS